MDVVRFAVGRDETSLHAAGVAESFPHRAEQRLGSLLVADLVGRARHNLLGAVSRSTSTTS